MNRQDAQTATAGRGRGTNRQGAQGAKKHEPDCELDKLARVVIDSALEVHRALGPGFLESVYEHALSIELGLRDVQHAQQVPIALSYKNHEIGQARLDLLVGGRLIVELKACDALLPIHVAQLLSYLKTTDLALGLLINFNVPLLRNGIRRVIRTH